jgi:hypothetical protein
VKRSLRWFVAVSAAVVAAGSSLVIGSARAEDAPGGGAAAPTLEKKIDHPFVLAWVGDWDVTESMGGTESKAKSKFALGIGGTALVEDYAGQMAGQAFAGHGVGKVAADGKTMSLWWFDNLMPEPLKLSGPLSDTSLEVTGNGPMGAMKIVVKQVEGGLDWEFSSDGHPWMTQRYRKAK